MFWDGYHIHSTLVASKDKHNEMLEFAARTGVKPLVQKHKFEGVETLNTIFKALEESKVRYRAVIEY